MPAPVFPLVHEVSRCIDKTLLELPQYPSSGQKKVLSSGGILSGNVKFFTKTQFGSSSSFIRHVLASLPLTPSPSAPSPPSDPLLLRLGKLVLHGLVHECVFWVGGEVLHCMLVSTSIRGDWGGRHRTSRPVLLVCSLLAILSVPWPEAGWPVCLSVWVSGGGDWRSLPLVLSMVVDEGGEGVGVLWVLLCWCCNGKVEMGLMSCQRGNGRSTAQIYTR